MKKAICLILALCLTAGLFAGCGKKKDQEASGQNSSSVSTVSSVATPSPAPVQMAKAVRVDADPYLNIRSQPSMEGEIVGEANDNSLLALLVEKPDDGWYQVSYGGKTAYISAEFAKVEEVTLEEYNKLKKLGTETSSETSSASSGDPTSSAPSSSAASSEPGTGASASSKAVSSKPADSDTQDGE